MRKRRFLGMLWSCILLLAVVALALPLSAEPAEKVRTKGRKRIKNMI
jgi:hypothetical protein